MSTITDNASTLMNNAQSLANTSNVWLRSIINELSSMRDDFYKLTASDFAADIPDFEQQNFPALIEEVSGQLDQVLVDAQNINGLLVNNSARAITKLNEIMAGVLPADVMPTLPVRDVATAADIINASNASLETERKVAETQAVEQFAALGYVSAPGALLSAIETIRLQIAEKRGEVAFNALREQQEKNASLFIESTTQLFALSKQVFDAWAGFSSMAIRVIAQIIADYERSPLLNAQIQAEQAEALVSAYAGLNRAAEQLANAAGQVYKAELAPYRLDVLRESLKVNAYDQSMKLTSAGKLAVARAFASALRGAGEVANSALGAVTSHGNFVERSFS